MNVLMLARAFFILFFIIFSPLKLKFRGIPRTKKQSLRNGITAFLFITYTKIISCFQKKEKATNECGFCYEVRLLLTVFKMKRRNIPSADRSCRSLCILNECSKHLSQCMSILNMLFPADDYLHPANSALKSLVLQSEWQHFLHPVPNYKISMIHPHMVPDFVHRNTTS